MLRLALCFLLLLGGVNAYLGRWPPPSALPAVRQCYSRAPGRLTCHCEDHRLPLLQHSCIGRPPLLQLRGGSGKAPRSVRDVLATFMGWLLSAGALTIYTPMIFSLLRTRDATGMSAATWALQLVGFVIFVTYHVRNGLPLSTYVDFAALAAQAATLLVLICLFQGQLFAVALIPPIGLAAALLLPKGAQPPQPPKKDSPSPCATATLPLSHLYTQELCNSYRPFRRSSQPARCCPRL